MNKILIVAAISVIVCGSASASVTDWTWDFNGQSASLGTANAASDDVDAADRQLALTSGGYGIGVYHERGLAGWSGDTGFYSTDIRAPLALMPGQSKTWVFYLWGGASYSYPLYLTWGYEYPAPSFDKMEYRLTYVRSASGATGGSVPVGTSLLLNQYPQWSWGFPNYRTTDGRTGYMFELTATVIPEPTSLLALAGGLAGLGGFALRRRRR